MTILLEQNIPLSIKEWLLTIKNNWKIYHTSDLDLSRAPDEVVYSAALEREAVIITSDEDFTDIRLFQKTGAGIIRLNIWPLTKESIQKALLRLFYAVAPLLFSWFHGFLIFLLFSCLSCFPYILFILFLGSSYTPLGGRCASV